MSISGRVCNPAPTSSLTFGPSNPVQFDVWLPAQWTNHTPQRDSSSLKQDGGKHDDLHLLQQAPLTVRPNVIFYRLVRMGDRHVDERLIPCQLPSSKEELRSSFSHIRLQYQRKPQTHIQVHHVVNDDLEIGARRIPATSAPDGPVKPIREDFRESFENPSRSLVAWVSTLFTVGAGLFLKRHLSWNGLTSSVHHRTGNL